MTVNPYGTVIDIVVAASAILFVASLLYAYKLRTGSRSGSLTEADVHRRGYFLIGLWVLLPPIWFLLEFQLLHPNLFDVPTEFERVKQAQELARNVWLAFVVVLAAIVGIKWPPGA